MARLRLEGREQAGDVAVFVLLCLVWLWAEVWAPVRGLERNLNSSCLDDIDKPIHDSIVSTGAAIGVAAVVLVTAFASVIASSRTLRVYNGGWRLLCFRYTRGALIAVVIAGAVTGVLKVVISRPRPTFLAVCQPVSTQDGAIVCSGDEAAVKEALKSFPSGHSSLSASASVYASLFLAFAFRASGSAQYPILYSVAANALGSLWRLFVVVLPTLLGVTIGVSRIADNHHHWDDVAAGFSIGVGGAIIGYALSFPVASQPRHDSGDGTETRGLIALGDSGNVERHLGGGVGVRRRSGGVGGDRSNSDLTSTDTASDGDGIAMGHLAVV